MKSTMVIPFDGVFALMVNLLKIKKNMSVHTLVGKCSAYFGAAPDLVHALWNELVGSGNLPAKGELKHLLWALSFMKTYCTYLKYSIDFETSVNNFKKWIWLFIPAIARMKHLVSTVM
jgi:hypothetical protein